MIAISRKIAANASAEASRLDDPSRERCGHIALQCHHEGSSVQFKSLTVSDAD